MELIHILEGVTVAVTLLMFSTGFFPIVNMYKTKDTRNVPFHMFLLGALGCLGMLHYGFMMDFGMIIFLNAVGSFLQCTYVVLYLMIAPNKSKEMKYLMLAILYLTSLYSYLYFGIREVTHRQDTLGMMSSLITTIMVCLPAVEVIDNIRNHNADGMPAVMLLGGLACAVCWLVYGYMLNDPNIYAPNIPGLLITSVKLYIIQLHSKPDKVKRS